jgi:hypothetical protein
MEEPNLLSPTLVINCISVKDDANHSGYNIQYLQRMPRAGALKGVKIGQMWLIEIGCPRNVFRARRTDFRPSLRTKVVFLPGDINLSGEVTLPLDFKTGCVVG